MKTYGDFFTGFGGATIGAKAAGLDVLFGVEYDADIAAVYRRNLGHIHVADVVGMDMSTLPYVDIFHASPPCTRASIASKGGEASIEMLVAEATCRYIESHLPTVVTLENVYQYRNFDSWRHIAGRLLSLGYTYEFWHVNVADYGVPQTRRRMIVVARRDGGTIGLPEKTHSKGGATLSKWVSWYDAIEDILDTLPDSKFAEWQLKRLPVDFFTSPTSVLVEGRNPTGGTKVNRS